tara:strand:- start:724 stop:963 length:240 start_codon:yes stop_codon:yes gene_type:complete
MFCQHKNLGVHSVGGFVECPDCFKKVPHPWYSGDHFAGAGGLVDNSKATVKQRSNNVPTGIERMAKEQPSLAKQMGIAE